MDMLIIFGAKYLIIFCVAAFFWCLVTLPKRRLYLASLSLIALPLAFVVSRIVTQLYYNARPFVVDNFVPLIAHAPDNGFPSDHVLLAATLATLVLFVNRRLGIVSLLVVVLIGASRVAAGVHHTLDIGASAAIAAVAVFTAHYILYWYRSKKV